VKGLVFVALSGLLIFWLIRRDQRRLAATNESLERTVLRDGAPSAVAAQSAQQL